MAKDLNRSIKIYIDNSDAMKSASQLQEKIKALDSELESLNSAGKRETSEYQQKERALQQLNASYARYQNKVEATRTTLNNLSGATTKELEAVRRAIKSTMSRMARDTDEYKQHVSLLANVEDELTKAKLEQNSVLGKNSSSWSKAADGFNKYFGIVTAFVGSITGLSLAFRKVAEDVAKMDDVYADVMKTTGMTKDEVVALNEEFKKIDTRTSREDLNKIAEEGGRIGIAKDEILEFSKAMDIANVALGDSFTGGVEEVSNKLGKLKLLFKETKEEKVDKAYMSIGSAINELGANGVASEANIAEFTTRIGSMPESLKPSIQDTLALGAAFEESGIEAEIASRAYGIVLNRASTDTESFARVMHISKKEVEDLINSNPTEFFLQFSKSMKGMSAVDTAKTLDDLKISADGANKVIGAASNNADRFRELLELSNDSFKEGTSLINEFNIKNETLAAKLDKAKKEFQEQALALGEKLNPVLLKSTNLVTYIIKLMPALINFFSKYGWTILWLIAIKASYMLSTMKLNGLTLYETALYYKSEIALKMKAAAMYVARVATLAYTAVVALATGNITLARRAWILLTATMSVNPWGLALAAITIVIGAIISWNKHLAETKTRTDLLIETSNEANKSISQEKTEIELLLSVARNESVSKEQRIKAIKRLNEISPEYLGFLNLENIHTQAVTNAVKAYTEELLKNAKIKAINNRIVSLDESILDKEKEISDLKKSSWATLGIIGDAIIARKRKNREEDIKAQQQEKEHLAAMNAELFEGSALDKRQAVDPIAERQRLASLEKQKGALEALHAKQLELQRKGNFVNIFGFQQVEQLEKVNLEISKTKNLLESVKSVENNQSNDKPAEVIPGKQNKSGTNGKTAEELKKEEYDKQMALLDKYLLDEQNKLADSRLKNQISQEEYNFKLEALDQSLMQKKMNILGILPDQQKALLDLTMQYQEKYYLNLMDYESEYRKSVLSSNKEISDNRINEANSSMKQVTQKNNEEAKKQHELLLQKRQQMIDLSLDMATNMGDMLGNFISGNEDAVRSSLKSIIDIALSALEAQVQMAIVGVQVQGLASMNPAQMAVALAKTIAIKALFAGVKAIVSNTLSGSKSSSSTTTSSGSTGTIVTNQRAAGKYDVIGANDGKTYRDVPYAGVATTGMVTVPTLVGEQGTELIVSAPDFSKLQRHINYPLVVQAIKDAQAGTVPQRAAGKYDRINSSVTNQDITPGFDYLRLDKLLDGLEKFTKKDLSINYYALEKVKNKVDKARSYAQKK